MSRDWRTIKVLDWDCAVFLPEQLEEPRDALLYLHDEDGLNELTAHAESLQRHDLAAIVPLCGPSWWLDQPVPAFDEARTPQQFVREHVVPTIKAEIGNPDLRFGLLGSGMGGQGVLKLSYAFPQEFPVVAAVAPAIDFHLLLKAGHPVLSEVFDGVEAARQHTPILHVHPLNWPRHQFFCCDPEDYVWFDSSDRLRMKLGSIGIPFDAELQQSCEGDRDAYRQQMLPRAIQVVREKLDEHRRSLVEPRP